MAKDDSGIGLYLIAVGRPDSALLRTALRLAREREIDAVVCPNVYAAVVAAARAADRRILVVGPLSELKVEKDYFFRIVTARGLRCGCLLDAGRPGKGPRVRSRAAARDLLVACRAGVTLLDGVADLRAVLEEWLATAEPRDAPGRHRGPAHTPRRAGGEVGDEWRATAAELSALLG